MSLEGISVGRGESAWNDASKLIGVSVRGDDMCWSTANLTAGEAVEVIRQLTAKVSEHGIDLNESFFKQSVRSDDPWHEDNIAGYSDYGGYS